MPERIDGYTPDMDPAHWAVIESFVRAAVTEAQPSTPYRASALLGAVAALTHWSWMGGIPLEPAAVLDRWNIERFITEGATTWSPASRGNRRSVLFRVSEALLGHEARTPRVAPLPPSDPSKPYDAAELVAFRSWAASQATEAKRRDSAVLLALGGGAGLATEDLLAVRRRHVTEVDGVAVVAVAGRRPRQVPVLAAWADTLAEAVAETDADGYAFRPGRSGRTKNSVSNLLGKTDGATKPQPQRLRATWIVHHLAVGTPVKPLMAAAGVKSLEALTRYLRFVPDADPAEALHRLRGELSR